MLCLTNKNVITHIKIYKNKMYLQIKRNVCTKHKVKSYDKNN